MPDRTCSLPGCEHKLLARRLCTMHYQRLAKYGTIDPRPPTPPCSVEGCGRPRKSRGLCKLHSRRQKAGTPLDRPVRGAMAADFCRVGGCDRPYKGLGLCATHLKRQRAGTPLDLPVRDSWVGIACTASDCDRPVTAKGLCSMHWQRQRHGVDLDKLVKKPTGGSCEIEGCDKPARKRGWCVMHYCRWAQHGDPRTSFKLERKHLVCTIEGCSNPTKSTALCKNHWERQLRGLQLDAPVRVFGVRQPCTGAGCDREAADLGLCRRCRERQSYLRNPEPWKAKTARRRARVGELTPDERELSDSYREAIRLDPCTYCGHSDGAETDHVFPLAKGGTDHWWNLTRACAPCNRRKHAHCGTHWHLKRGTWVEPARPVPALAEADPGDRRIPAASGVDPVRGCEVGQNYRLFDLLPDYGCGSAA